MMAGLLWYGNGWWWMGCLSEESMDGTKSFFQLRSSYIRGFGEDFWLNLNNIHHLTAQVVTIQLWEWIWMTLMATHILPCKYSTSLVLDSSTDYQLKVMGYSGDAGDSLTCSIGRAFTVRSPSSRETNQFRQTWWGTSSPTDQDSQLAFINGNYRSGQYTVINSQPDGVCRSTWREISRSLTFTVRDEATPGVPFGYAKT